MQALNSIGIGEEMSMSLYENFVKSKKMKRITNKTSLKQGGNIFHPIEIDGVIYWVGDVSKHGDWCYYEKDLESPIKFQRGEYLNSPKIVAQSQPKIESVPVINLNSYVFNFLDKACSDWHRQEYGFVANVPIRKAFVEGFNLDQRKWTDADLLKAIDLAREENGWPDNSMEYAYTKEKIIEQVCHIEVIHIDEYFNIKSYE